MKKNRIVIRKILIGLVAILFVSGHIYAQEREMYNPYDFKNYEQNNPKETIWVIDSAIYYINFEGEMFLHYRRKTLSRNEQGNPLSTISHLYDGNGVFYQKKDTTVYEYLPNGYQTRFRRSWNYPNQEWSDTTNYIKKTQSGKTIDYIKGDWDYLANEFIEGYKLYSTVDNYQNYNTTNHFIWHSYDDTWEHTLLKSYQNTYTNDSILTSVTITHWNEETEVWDNDQRDSYSYYDNGDIKEIVKSDWNFSLNQYIDYIQLTYEYNEFGNNTIELLKNWNLEEEVWENNKIYINSFNENQEITYSLYQKWDANNLVWKNFNRDNYYYDSNDNITSIVSQSWNNEIEEWENNKEVYYYYSELEVAGVKDIFENQLSIYPNPTTNFLKIKFDGLDIDTEINIYSILGTVIKTVRMSKENIINLSDMKKGVYFLHFKTEEGEIIKKVIKN